MSEPNANEQYLLELINAERAGAGVQPLAGNGQLNVAAENHSQWMIDADVFSHTGANGSSATARMQAAGYQFSGSWSNGENIAWMSLRAPTGYADEVQQLHVNLMNSAGHRANLLNGSFTEVGLGFQVGEYQGWQGAFVTEDFARVGSQHFLTGVAYADGDGDRFYDPGEGLGGLTVTAVSAGGATYVAQSYGSGGYDLALSTGSYTVTFSGANIATSTQHVEVGALNVKLDLVNPASGVQPGNLIGGADADNLVGVLGAANYIRGNDGGDTITGGDRYNDVNGNKGADSIVGRSQSGDWLLGGQGDDRIDASASSGHNILNGNLGIDVVIGGSGGDTLRGGQGDDLVQGGAGADLIFGDLGVNTITGGAGADTFRNGAGVARDLVTDFHQAEGDRVQIDASLTYAVAQASGDVEIAVSNGDVIVLQNTSLTSLTQGWLIQA
ncbi:CAP domain-containing protein [Phenylobacterium sp. LjRoot219]|uniref:CAP domain-containing protein n=1 Tax=Phenylobacterium sp. LjRoot219 TaxID=3342283 RepID=UPI003ECD64BE